MVIITPSFTIFSNFDTQKMQNFDGSKSTFSFFLTTIHEVVLFMIRSTQNSESSGKNDLFDYWYHLFSKKWLVTIISDKVYLYLRDMAKKSPFRPFFGGKTSIFGPKWPHFFDQKMPFWSKMPIFGQWTQSTTN